MTTIKILKSVKPPLLWEPEAKAFTDEFLASKARAPDGPSEAELRDGPNSVLNEAARILGRCLPPTSPAGRETGLVVGYVQSGKTMSFETVIALARDNGYGLVIVLAGTKNNLRDQSEARLTKDLGIDDGGDDWLHLSNPTKTQRALVENKVSAWRRNKAKKSLLITVLKHGGHLEKLATLLRSINLSGVPALIIDDESDQASLNTKAAAIRRGKAAADDMSTTYERILGLRDVVPHHSFLQYTATPQANLLLAQTDVLNPSFSELVTPGDGYTGGDAFFKSTPGLVEDIPAAEVPNRTSPPKSAPKTLLKALRFFLLVAAQHSLTRRKGRGAKDRNRSMMVHPAAETAQHRLYKNWVDRALAAIKRQVVAQYEVNLPSVLTIFQTEYDSLSRTYAELKPLPELIAALVDEVFDELNCVEVNGTPDAEAKVDWKQTPYWILVGGAKLDRGYTVEGLCTTYMPRPLGTSAAADTLQQRARFFGYKRPYLGLCRVFLEQGVRRAFAEYLEHESFVRGALIQTRGKPLRDWRRDFILTSMLQPTRPNVVGLGVRRLPVAEWVVPKALHRGDGPTLEANRRALENASGSWEAKFGKVNAATIERLAPAKSGPSPNEVIQGVPLTEVLDDFLLPLEARDPRDAEQHSAALVALGVLRAKYPDLTVDVYVMNPSEPAYRSRAPDKGLIRGQMGQYFSASADTVNDRDFRTEDRISIQLRRFNLGLKPRDPSSTDIKDVAWYALYIPQKFKRDLVVEERD